MADRDELKNALRNIANGIPNPVKYANDFLAHWESSAPIQPVATQEDAGKVQERFNKWKEANVKYVEPLDCWVWIEQAFKDGAASQPSNALPQTLTEADRARIVALAEPYRVEGYLSSQKHYGFSYAQLLCFVMSLGSQPSNAVQDAPKDEATRFTSWANGCTFNFKRAPDGGYYWSDLDSAWRAWQERARYAAATVPPVVQAPSDEQIDAAMPMDVQRSAECHQVRWRDFARKVLSLTTASNAGEAAPAAIDVRDAALEEVAVLIESQQKEICTSIAKRVRALKPSPPATEAGERE